ncbi:hypothetical protein LguiB_001503 [Lonicera macranthoides]
MEEDDDQAGGFGAPDFAPRSHISLSPFPSSISSPSPRRLSSHFTPPSRPIKRQLAWVSLQGRLINADEASSAKAIGGGLSPAQAVAWDMFSPIHRFLIVAVIAVAANESEKNKQILKLRKSVQLRDQVLSSMQEKLDNLCEQVNFFKDQPETTPAISFKENKEQLPVYESSSHKIKSVSSGCQLCDQHGPPANESGKNMDLNAYKYNADETFKHKIQLANEAQQPEERRMSDLSDWAPSVSSSTDIQLSSLAIEQDMYNLQKECEEKDSTIKELSTFLHSSEVLGSKRIAELEDIIRRKNMIITKLKKDMVVLEQKVMHLTRLRRPSFTPSSSSAKKLPLMSDNLLYDMDSSTSPSSSDSDSSLPKSLPPLAPIVKKKEIPFPNSEVKRKVAASSNLVKSSDRLPKSRPVTPLKEKSMNQNQAASAGGDLNGRRRGPHKRWA